MFQAPYLNISSKTCSQEHVKSPMGPGLEFFISEQSSHQEPAAHVFKPFDTRSCWVCVSTDTQHIYAYIVGFASTLDVFPSLL